MRRPSRNRNTSAPLPFQVADTSRPFANPTGTTASAPSPESRSMPSNPPSTHSAGQGTWSWSTVRLATICAVAPGASETLPGVQLSVAPVGRSMGIRTWITCGRAERFVTAIVCSPAQKRERVLAWPKSIDAGVATI